jgi:superfamily II DNA or RNA helicase
MSILLNTAGWGTVEQRRRLLQRLTFTVQPDPRYASQEVKVYVILKNKVLFVCPFSVGHLDEYRALHVTTTDEQVQLTWQAECVRNPVKPVKRSKPSNIDPIVHTPVFEGSLTTMQESIFRDMWNLLMSPKRSSLLHVATGFGKTFLSVYLAMKLRQHCSSESLSSPFITMIVVHRSEIQKQWMNTIQQRLPGCAHAQVLNRKDSFTSTDHPMQFVVINTVNIDHRWTPETPFHCHLLILDEAHTYVSSTQAIMRMLSLRPQYLVALSATPDRSDGRSQALDMIASDRVVRKMRRLFHVYHYQTPWKGRVVLSPSTGELDWNAILEAQALQPRRNKLICEFIHLFWRAERTILILCKRVEQAHILQKMLEDTRSTFISSEVLVGDGLVSNQSSSPDSSSRPRVLLSTYSMVGVGFSDDRLDTLIIGADVEQMALQYAGRIFRRPDVSSVILDIVDPRMPGMRKHFRSRCQVYEDMGGIIEAFEDAHDCSLLPIDLQWDS